MSSKTTIRNFGEVNPNFFRGAQPRVDEHRNEYAELAAMGVRTVIDLCDEHDRRDYARSSAEKAGLLYHWLPMSDREYPQPQTASSFLALATNPKLWPTMTHCAGGRHRTGAMTAVYRMQIDKWNLKRALAEMESYFGWPVWIHWLSHTEIRRFVRDYAAKLQQKADEH